MRTAALDRYAVIGNPVSHSKSPLIHMKFAEQTGERLQYGAFRAEPETFAGTVQDFFLAGGKGLNVTVPFKQAAWEMAGQLSEAARLGGAVNTLLLDAEGVLQGHNTDGIGLIRDIKNNHGGRIRGKAVLVLGAGGASRGILQPLLEEGPALLTVANRTLERAEELAALFCTLGKITACGFEALAGQRFDWVINATSASLQGKLPALPAGLLKSGAWCYDLMYADVETPFCRWASQAGAEKAMDGLGMLVEQAAESFFLWRGVRPRTAEIISSLR